MAELLRAKVTIQSPQKKLFSALAKQLHDAVDEATDGIMARNYNRDLNRHLEETLAKCDALEHKFETYKQKTDQELFKCRTKIAEQDATITRLIEENMLLKADNARLKRIQNNDSKTSSLSPSRDQKSTKPANTYNSRTIVLAIDNDSIPLSPFV